MNYVSQHWSEILLVLVAAHTLARRIVDLTPSQEDNAVLAQIDKALQLVGLNFRD